MSTEVTLPALGESVTEGTISRWLKTVGDTIDVDERLAAGIVALTADHVVLVNFPRIPGPIAVGSALGALDVAVCCGVAVLADLDAAKRCAAFV